MRKEVYLLLGSNLDDREKNLLLAIKRINEQAGTVLAVSSLYETQPWGEPDQAEFLNQVIEIETNHTPEQLLDKLLFIENELGRQRGSRWGPRTIDIDILFYGREIISKKNLVIPHPGITDRRFNLVPLSEIAPNFVHPRFNKKCKQLLEECTDPLAVRLYVPTNS